MENGDKTKTMTTKLNKTTIRTESLLRQYEIKIAAIKAKFAKDWKHAFEWQGKEMIMLQCQKATIASFLTFINNEPQRAEEWLEHNIEANTTQLISCNYLSNSSNELANLANQYEALAKSEMIGEFKLLIQLVKEDTNTK